MNETSRRSFLKRTAAAVTALGGGALTGAGCAPAEPAVASGLDGATLRAIGAIALPSELGAEGVEAAVAAFEGWLAGFEPVAELAHGYGSDEIRYGPPDPGPRWRAQLAALEMEAQKRHARAFLALAPEEQRAMIAREVGRESGGMPEPQYAQHVATALLSHFFGSPGAVDLCYQAEIGQYGCRGLASAPSRPAPLARKG